ncbi:MAG: matrixin family metalloprotease [Saprospiraceae bacterium]|nr:matrixin family metalloprotease [Saprospiraceae bacterium]
MSEENVQEAQSIIENRQKIGVYSRTQIPSYTTVNNITYSIMPDNGGFTAAQIVSIISGINAWKNNTNILNFVRISDNNTSANIRIKRLDNGPNDSWGNTDLFPNGIVNSAIGVFLDEIVADCTGPQLTCLRNIVTHEVGHCLGLDHTDNLDNSGAAIPVIGSSSNDPTSIMNSGITLPINSSSLLPGPNLNDYNVISSLFPISSIYSTISSVTKTFVDDNKYNIKVNINQTFGRNYVAKADIIKNGVVVKSVTGDIGILASSTINMGVVTLLPGQYQVKLTSKNYRADFTQPNTSTVSLTI